MKTIKYPAGSMIGQVTVTLRDPVEMAVMTKARLKKYVRSIKDHFYALKAISDPSAEEASALAGISDWLTHAHRFLNK